MDPGQTSKVILRTDVLSYLPRTGTKSFHHGDVIFDEHKPCQGLHLIVQGRVKLAILDEGFQTVVDIFSDDDLFGESALFEEEHVVERAIALESVSLMFWSRAEIEEKIERQPRLGIALTQILAKRGLDYKVRLQGFALHQTPERLVRALLHFANHLGTPAGDGSLAIPPLTHETIAEYVGTTREAVTLQMNHFRQQGLLRYSRRAIQVYVDRLREHLNSPHQRKILHTNL